MICATMRRLMLALRFVRLERRFLLPVYMQVATTHNYLCMCWKIFLAYVASLHSIEDVRNCYKSLIFEKIGCYERIWIFNSREMSA